MLRTILCFTAHGHEPVLKQVTARKPIDVRAAWNRAVNTAREAGFTGMNYEVSEQYLAAEGLAVTNAPCIHMTQELITDSCCPVAFCECRDCSAYDEGSCFRYGGNVDGFADGYDSDCIHSTGGVYLTCDGARVITAPFWVDESFTPQMLVEYLLDPVNRETIGRAAEELASFIDQQGPEWDWRAGQWQYEEDL